MKSEVFLMDCMEGMKQFPDNYFDLALVDPPYGININNNIGRRKNQKHSGYKKAYWDNSAPNKEYFIELFRISKNQIIWGANYFISLIPFDSSCWLLWDKGFSEEVTFSQFEMAWTSFLTTSKKFDKNPNQLFRIHPTQKPIQLYSWIYKNYLPDGGKVIDTHGGSMSNVIAALKTGNIEITCFEIDKDYYDSAKKRIESYFNQLNIFNEKPEIIFK